MPMRTIKLAYGVEPRNRADGVKDYKVILVKNSVDYAPGQILQRAEVDDLCRQSGWDVTVVSLMEPAR